MPGTNELPPPEQGPEGAGYEFDQELTAELADMMYRLEGHVPDSPDNARELMAGVQDAANRITVDNEGVARIEMPDGDTAKIDRDIAGSWLDIAAAGTGVWELDDDQRSMWDSVTKARTPEDLAGIEGLRQDVLAGATNDQEARAELKRLRGEARARLHLDRALKLEGDPEHQKMKLIFGSLHETSQQPGEDTPEPELVAEDESSTENAAGPDLDPDHIRGLVQDALEEAEAEDQAPTPQPQPTRNNPVRSREQHPQTADEQAAATYLSTIARKIHQNSDVLSAGTLRGMTNIPAPALEYMQRLTDEQRDEVSGIEDSRQRFTWATAQELIRAGIVSSRDSEMDKLILSSGHDSKVATDFFGSSLILVSPNGWAKSSSQLADYLKTVRGTRPSSAYMREFSGAGADGTVAISTETGRIGQIEQPDALPEAAEQDEPLTTFKVTQIIYNQVEQQLERRVRGTVMAYPRAREKSVNILAATPDIGSVARRIMGAGTAMQSGNPRSILGVSSPKRIGIANAGLMREALDNSAKRHYRGNKDDVNYRTEIQSRLAALNKMVENNPDSKKAKELRGKPPYEQLAIDLMDSLGSFKYKSPDVVDWTTRAIVAAFKEIDRTGPK